MSGEPGATPLPRIDPEEVWYTWGADRVYASAADGDLIPGAVATPVGVSYPDTAMPEEIRVAFFPSTGKSRYRLVRDGIPDIDPDPQKWVQRGPAVPIKYRLVLGDD